MRSPEPCRLNALDFSQSAPVRLLTRVRGSCMKECAWPCSHDCHTRTYKNGVWSEKGLHQGLKCSAAHRLFVLFSFFPSFFFFFSQTLHSVKESDHQGFSHREDEAESKTSFGWFVFWRQGMQNMVHGRCVSERQVTGSLIWLLVFKGGSPAYSRRWGLWKRKKKKKKQMVLYCFLVQRSVKAFSVMLTGEVG